MRRIRVIPTLLLNADGGLVKTVKFAKRTYIGDPINAVKIFNAREVDELVLLDIDATPLGRTPNFELIEDIVSEAFMPVAYGGGVTSIDEMASLFRCGLEKVIISSSVHRTPQLVNEAAARFGSQSVVVCIDVKKSWFGKYQVRSGPKSFTNVPPQDIARTAVTLGAGELIVHSMDRDGTYLGYDLELLRLVASKIEVPVIACGGAAMSTISVMRLWTGIAMPSPLAAYSCTEATREEFLSHTRRIKKLRERLYEKV